MKGLWHSKGHVTLLPTIREKACIDLFFVAIQSTKSVVNCKISNMVTAIRLEGFCYLMMDQWFALLSSDVHASPSKGFPRKRCVVHFSTAMSLVYPCHGRDAFPCLCFALDFTFKTFLEMEFFEQNNCYGFYHVWPRFFWKVFLILNLISSYVK